MVFARQKKKIPSPGPAPGLLAALLLLLGAPAGVPAQEQKKAPTLAALVEDFRAERRLPPKGRLRTLTRITARQEPGVVDFLLVELPREEPGPVGAQMARALAGRLADGRAARALPRLWPGLAPALQRALCAGLKPPLPPGPRAFFLDLFRGEACPVTLRRYLVRPLALPPGEETLPFLRRVLEQESDYLLLHNAARCLSQVPDSPAKLEVVDLLLGLSHPNLQAMGIENIPTADRPWFLRQMKKLLQTELVSFIRPRAQVAAAMARRLVAAGGVESLALFLDLVASRPRGGSAPYLKLAPRFDSQACLDYWLEEGLKSRDELLILVTLEALTGFTSERAVKGVKEMLRNRNDRVRRAAVRALARIETAGRVEALERVAARGRRLEERIEALDALHRIRRGEPEWVDELLRFFRSRHAAIQARALDLLARLGEPRVYKEVERAARSRNWLIRSAFYSYVKTIREARAVPLLLDALEKETGRLRGEVEDALERIAGLTFRFDTERWRRWWEQEKEGFTPPPLRENKGEVRRDDRYGNTYYGIPVVSRRVAFILDHSGSMAAKTGTGGRTKLDLAKDSLTQVLVNFRRETHFNVIFFQTLVQPWEKKLTPATSDNRRRALEYVRRKSPMGGTNIHGALDLAFQDESVDTIYLLSDGMPTAGRITDPDRLLDEVLSWNLVRRITIHCISLGGGNIFLETLAARAGGQYVVRNR